MMFLNKRFLSACQTDDVPDKVFPICLWDIWCSWIRGSYLPSPWYNRTGWLGVKHQFTYSYLPVRHKSSLMKCFLSVCVTEEVPEKVSLVCLWDIWRPWWSVSYLPVETLDIVEKAFPIRLWDIWCPWRSVSYLPVRRHILWRPWRSVSYLPVTHMTFLTKCFLSLTKCFLSACDTYDVLDEVFPILDEVFPICLWHIWRPWRSVSYLPVTYMTSLMKCFLCSCDTYDVVNKCFPSAWQVFPKRRKPVRRHGASWWNSVYANSGERKQKKTKKQQSWKQWKYLVNWTLR